MKDNQKKNRKSFAVKAGCTAGLAAVFGFVASGVFISTTTLATNVQNAKIQTAVVAEAENASDQNGIVTTDVNIGSTAEANEATEQETGKALTVQEVAANVMPAMVAITNTTVEEVNDYFGGFGGFGLFGGYGHGSSDGSNTVESVSAGSGEIIGETDDQLIIATNQHVIADSTTLSVAFVDESAAPAYVLGEDASTDLAVIAVNKSDLSEGTLQAIRVVAIGSSDDLVNRIGYYEVGETVKVTLEVQDGSGYSAKEVEVTLQAGAQQEDDKEEPEKTEEGQDTPNEEENDPLSVPEFDDGEPDYYQPYGYGNDYGYYYGQDDGRGYGNSDPFDPFGWFSGNDERGNDGGWGSFYFGN